MNITLSQAMTELPLIAILRGITPNEVLDFAAVLVNNGFKVIEVPLNSPSPYESIKLLSDKYGDQVIIGAGTVVTKEQVDLVKVAGGRIIISPHADADVIRYTKQQQLYSVPGFMSPTEAYSAFHAGADALKLFPADSFGPSGLKAITTIMPDIAVFPVGGVEPSNMQAYVDSGAKGFGLGSGLYKSGMSLNDFTTRTENYVLTIKKANFPNL